MKHRDSLRLLPLLLAAVLLLSLCGCGAKEQTTKQNLDQFETATLGVIEMTKAKNSYPDADGDAGTDRGARLGRTRPRCAGCLCA